MVNNMLVENQPPEIVIDSVPLNLQGPMKRYAKGRKYPEAEHFSYCSYVAASTHNNFHETQHFNGLYTCKRVKTSYAKRDSNHFHTKASIEPMGQNL